MSLLEQAARDLEPPSDTELLLTQYSELLEGDFPYQVTGILTPSQRVTVYDYSDYSWDEALARDWSTDAFTADWNAIGRLEVLRSKRRRLQHRPQPHLRGSDFRGPGIPAADSGFLR